MISLRTALSEDLPAEKPLPWWIRHDQLLAAVVCTLIFIIAGHAVGEF